MTIFDILDSMNCIIKINPPMSFCHFNMFPRKFKITTCGSGCISVERPCALMRWVGRTQRKGVGGGNSPGVLGYRTEWWPLLTGSGSHRGLLSRRWPLRGGRGAQAWEGQGTHRSRHACGLVSIPQSTCRHLLNFSLFSLLP